MATKKSGPTLAALNAQIAALQAQADALRKKEVAEVVAKIKDAIAHYGLTAADLGLATGARKNAKLPAAGGDKPASKRRKKAGPKPVGEDGEVQGRPRQHMGRHGQAAGMVQGCFGFRQDTRGTAGKELSQAQRQRVPLFGGCLSPVRAGARIG
jgi:hypothetical protein